MGIAERDTVATKRAMVQINRFPFYANGNLIGDKIHLRQLWTSHVPGVATPQVLKSGEDE